ncbi:MAG TPA: PEPxxWA-CTERM sorting domain-containing protein [Caulobacteraceae bacterium]|nr:PEPxxWA-CTERM sorting domain-containing protein [Caulobacteraceae bacterium]
MKHLQTNWRAALAVTTVLAGAALAAPAAASVTFTTFVSASAISTVEGQDNTIGFNYAGNKFVGSVYFGGNNLQLYSTDLTGGNVQKFGSPLPSGGGEVVLAGALGLGGFSRGNVFASPANQSIYEYANSGGSPSLFATLPGNAGASRQILFDPGSSFGGDMIVTTTSGNIYTVNSGGTVNLLASIGADTEGMDIASSAYGQYAGDLLVASEGTGQVHAISPGGTVTLLNLVNASGAPTTIPLAETLSVVPTNLGSGNPLEGFYVANYPIDIQKAAASDFLAYKGDAIVTSEFGSNSPLWLLTYNGNTANTFTVSQIGTLPGQSEDGIFVTAQRIHGGVPEPATWALMLVGFGGLGTMLRRRSRDALAAI